MGMGSRSKRFRCVENEDDASCWLRYQVRWFESDWDSLVCEIKLEVGVAVAVAVYGEEREESDHEGDKKALEDKARRGLNIKHGVQLQGHMGEG